MILKIRTKLLVVMLIIGIVAALPITFLSMASLIRSSKEQAKDFGEKSAYYNSEIIRTWLTEKAEILTGLKTQLNVNHLSNSETVELLRVYSDINPHFISIFIGTENNEMIDAYGWIPDGNYVVTERPWYSAAFEQESYITTSVYRDVNMEESVVAIASGIEFQETRGVIATNIYLDYVVDIINKISYGENGFAVLLDDNYNIITGPHEEDDIIVFNQIFDIIAPNDEVFIEPSAFEIEVDGVDYIAAYSNVEGFEWNLFLVAPLYDFTEPAYTIRNQTIYLLIGTLFMIVFINYHMSRTISRPIESLISGVSRIAKGDFDTPINIPTHDEIGKLSKELDKMRINLKNIFESIKYESNIIAMNSSNLIRHLNETYHGTSRFFSMLSHDIKTPITLIKGYSKALSMEMVDKDKTLEYIEKIQYRTEQIENIVADILDNTYEAHDIQVNLKTIKIYDYINMVFYNTETYLNNQHHHLVPYIDYKNIDEDWSIAVDITKIQRVINNILSNAVKYSDKDSSIELVIKMEDGRILTYFKDFGIGIKAEEQEKIFNMFYKADDSKKGYGLGLYISKAIIEAHQGEFFLKSKYQKGTISGFYLNLDQS